MATHSSTLACEIPWTEEPGGLQSWGRKEFDTTERLHFHALEKEMAEIIFNSRSISMLFPLS